MILVLVEAEKNLSSVTAINCADLQLFAKNYKNALKSFRKIAAF
jgi:hypothetical protein